MESCPIGILQYNRPNNYDHEITNTHLAANNQYYCKQCRKRINLADEKSHLQSNGHRSNFKNVVL